MPNFQGQVWLYCIWRTTRPRIFRLFWIPKKIPTSINPPQKILTKFSYPKKSRNQKFQTQKLAIIYHSLRLKLSLSIFLETRQFFPWLYFVITLLLRLGAHLPNTVDPRNNEGPRYWQNTFAITKFRHIEVPFHIFWYLVKKIVRYTEPRYIDLYKKLRYIEVSQYLT